MFTWDAGVFLSADSESRRPSCTSLGTIIISADDLQQEAEEEKNVPSPPACNRQYQRRLSAPANAAAGSNFVSYLNTRKSSVRYSSIPKVKVQVCD